jgi:hypothetical protein
MMGAIVNLRMPLHLSVRLKLDKAARLFLSGAHDFRGQPRKDLAQLRGFQRHVRAATALFKLPEQVGLLAPKAPTVARSLASVRMPMLRDRAQRLFVPVARHRGYWKRHGDDASRDVDILSLHAALGLLDEYAAAAIVGVSEIVDRRGEMEFKHRGDELLRDYLEAVCRLWRDDLGRPIKTSVEISAKSGRADAAGPMVRFVKRAMALVEVEKSPSAIRAAIRRFAKQSPG